MPQRKIGLGNLDAGWDWHPWEDRNDFLKDMVWNQINRPEHATYFLERLLEEFSDERLCEIFEGDMRWYCMNCGEGKTDPEMPCEVCEPDAEEFDF